MAKRNSSSKASNTPQRRGCLSRLLLWGGGILGVVIVLGIFNSLTSTSSPPSIPPTAANTPTMTAESILPAYDAIEPISSPTDTDSASNVLPAPTATLASTSLPPTVTPTIVPTVAVETNRASSEALNLLPAVLTAANLRAGPSTESVVAGSVQPGEPLEITGISPDGQWYALRAGLWIHRDLVANAPDASLLSIIAPPATTIPAPTPVPVVVEPALSTISRANELPASDCSCDSNTYNCSDFPTFSIKGDMAQACFLRCMAITGLDIHALDGDNDGSACEWSGWD